MTLGIKPAKAINDKEKMCISIFVKVEGKVLNGRHNDPWKGASKDHLYNWIVDVSNQNYAQPLKIQT